MVGASSPKPSVGHDGTMQAATPSLQDRGAEKKLWESGPSNVHLLCQCQTPNQRQLSTTCFSFCNTTYSTYRL
jgi:hypothetical protein